MQDRQRTTCTFQKLQREDTHPTAIFNRRKTKATSCNYIFREFYKKNETSQFLLEMNFEYFLADTI